MNNDLVILSPTGLGLAASLVVIVALLSWRLHLGLEKRLLIGMTRSALQLALIGWVLKALFAQHHPLLMVLVALVMLTVAGYEVWSRQAQPLRGMAGVALGMGSLMISSFTVTLLALHLVIRVEPWYQAQYLIPLLGMLLGNSMSGVALTLDHLNRQCLQQRSILEARLLLGATWTEAVAPIRRDALRTGLIPIINAMAAAGVVSLPGMMTGQILAGSPPMEAAKYQMMILFLIAGGTGLGAIFAAWVGSGRLFDERQRLRLEFLRPARG